MDSSVDSGPLTVLSYGQFPDPIEVFLEDSLLEASNSARGELFDLVFDEDLLDTKANGVLRRVANVSSPKLERQLLGTVGTFLWLRQMAGIDSFTRSSKWQHRFDVAELQSGETIFLQYPGKKTLEEDHHLGPFTLDFAVNVEGWVNTRGGATPRHAEIFSDVYWKVKSARDADADALVQELAELVSDIHAGLFPTEALDRCTAVGAFNVGNRLEPLAHSLYWIFIQEDFNYPTGQGRDMSCGILMDLCSLREAEFTEADEPYPDSVQTKEFPEYYGIITGENVKGFDPDGRGEMLSLSTVTQESFSL